MNEPDQTLMDCYETEDVFQHKLAFPGGYGLSGRLALAILAMKGAQHYQNSLEDSQAEAAAMNNRIRALEQLRMMQVSMPLRYTRPPMILGPRIGVGHGGSDPVVEGGDTMGIPLGMDQGMVRTASAIGRDLAQGSLMKMAGIGTGTIGMGAKTVAGVARASAAPVEKVVTQGVSKIAPNVTSEVTKPGLWNRSMSGGKWKTTVPVLAGGAALAGGTMLGAHQVGKVMSRENKPADWGGTQSGAPTLAYGVNQWGTPSVRSPFIAG